MYLYAGDETQITTCEKHAWPLDISFNPFPAGEFELPVLPPPKTGLSGSVNKPETSRWRQLFLKGMHTISEFKQNVVRHDVYGERYVMPVPPYNVLREGKGL